MYYVIRGCKYLKKLYQFVILDLHGSIFSVYGHGAWTSSSCSHIILFFETDFIQPENFPEHLKLALQNIKEREEQEIRQRELDKSTCKVILYYYIISNKAQSCFLQEFD